MLPLFSLNASDSSLVKTARADKLGNFASENPKDGSYLVMATSAGHAKAYSAAFAVSGPAAKPLR